MCSIVRGFNLKLCDVFLVVPLARGTVLCYKPEGRVFDSQWVR
jgi:hypothetical protein